MSVERLVDWAAAILQESDSALSTKTLADRLGHQFYDTLDKLEVLLSLDKRFVRDVNGNWRLGPVRSSEAIIPDLLDQALALRERAVEALLKERQPIEDKVAEIRARLEEIDCKLTQLGYQPMRAPVRVPRSAGSYSLEYHLNGLPQQTRELALQVHQAILDLPDVCPAFNKYHIAYSTHQRFAILYLRKSKLVILVRADVSFEDPKGWTRDATGRRLGLERVFDLADAEGLEYAMRLIRQSFLLVSERGESGIHRGSHPTPRGSHSKVTEG